MTITFNPIELTQLLIQVPSVSPDTGEALDIIERHLSEIGFHCHRQTFQNGGHYATPNLYATIGDEKGANFCFAGHTDVVPPGDLSAWSYPPFQGVIANEYLYGRGAADMKGAIAAFICAVRQFLRKETFKGKISLLITGDEEAEAINGTVQALKWIQEKGEKLDACLIGEATCAEKLGDTIKVGRRGSLTGRLTVHGRQGHVAYPHLAQNPLPALVQILTALTLQNWNDGDDLFQSSNLEITSIDTDNLATNVIPAQALATFNIRFNPKQTVEELKAWVHKICTQHTKQYGIDWLSESSSFYTADGFLRQSLMTAVKDVTSLSPRLSTDGGTSDGRFIHKYCPVVEFGVRNATIHQIDECFALPDLIQLQETYVRLLSIFFER